MQYPMIAQPQYAFAPTMMAEGGLVPAAKAVQNQGRGRDTMLVHMSPKEVGGLQALAMQHGGSLSINPQTGLPEAGFLENILPTLLGVGGMFLGIPPHLTALAVGGIQTARTGDLGKGLMAGLGAYGGANLAGSLGAAGAQQGVQAATAAGADLTAQTGALAADNARDALLMRGAETLPSSVAALPTPTGVPPTFMQNAAQAGQGVQNLFASGATGEGARAAAMGNLGGTMGAVKTAGSVISPMLTPEPYKMPQEEKREVPQYTQSRVGPRFPSNEQIRTDSSEFSYFDAPQYTRISPSAPVETPRFGFGEGMADFLAMSDEEKRRQQVPTYMLRAAEGGVTALAKGGVPMLEDGGFVLTKKAVDGLGKGDNKRGQQVASAGLGAIPIKGAGVKRGPRAGVDDKIKTTIEGKRPALVSNGEAYVPKKQVARKGGAKAFYALMDKAEKQARQAKRA
jgi:hypothetical protein